MRVTMKPIQAYEASVNGTELGKFVAADTWNGLLELLDAEGKKLIVSNEPQIGRILGFIGSDTTWEANVISGSPDLIYKCKLAAEKATAPVEASA